MARKLITLLICIVTSMIADAQSPHARLWCIGNYFLDFKTEPVTITKMPRRYWSAVLYNNGDGEMELYGAGLRLCGKDDSPFFYDGYPLISEIDFFVPSPNDEGVVYCFNRELCFMVDVGLKKILSIFEISNATGSWVAVHHANCKDVWIVYFNENDAFDYLLTSDGIRYVSKNRITSNPIPDPFIDNDLRVSLSRECDHFSAVSKLSRELIFGNFDRKE